MTQLEAIKARHSVRAYKEQALAADAVEGLMEKVKSINDEVPGMHVQLVLNEPKAFASPMARYGKVADAFSLNPGEKVVCVISLGYGETQGSDHKRRTAAEVSNIESLGGDCPDWFKAGVEAALLAPTAVNQQKFMFEYKGDGKVSASRSFSMIGYTWTDLGIAKLHFEIAAGKHNFEWV